MNGANGWFRVGYEGRNWGYGPFALSATARFGSWYILAPYSQAVRLFNRRMCAMVSAADPLTVEHRTKYFGARGAILDNPYGWSNEDQLGKDSVYAVICAMAAELALL